nr:centromere protein R isoform X1 [Taeniopygia guttata]
METAREMPAVVPGAALWVILSGFCISEGSLCSQRRDKEQWPVKRALNLDTVQKDNATDATPLKAKMSNLNFYSPTTGTRQLSPCSSPTWDRAQDPSSAPAEGDGNEQSNSKSGFSRRGQPQTEDDVFLQLQSQVRNSLPRILKLRANLTSLKALEGSRELENILGVSHSSCDLSAELQKTQALVSQAEKLQLLKENYGKVPARDPIQATGSAAFLLSFLDRRKEPLGLLPAPRHSQSDQGQGIM